MLRSWWEAEIFTVWVQPLPPWRSWGSSSRWRRRRPAGRPERSDPQTASSPWRRPPEESTPRSSLEDKSLFWVCFFTSGSRRALEWECYRCRSGRGRPRWWGPEPSASPPWRRPGSWWPYERWSSSPRSAALSRKHSVRITVFLKTCE